jgi:hypothetical protein
MENRFHIWKVMLAGWPGRWQKERGGEDVKAEDGNETREETKAWPLWRQEMMGTTMEDENL